MILALLREQHPKTQTRRTRGMDDVAIDCADGKREQPTLWRTDGHGTWVPYCRLETTGGLGIPGEPIRCPYGIPDDQLHVKESWATEKHHDALPPRDVPRTARIHYLADGPKPSWAGRSRVARFMVRWMSRITLELTDVRVERLQDITEEDARAEGVTPFPDDPSGDCWSDGKHRTAFNYLWNKMHGWVPNAFDANPWVWVLGFRRIDQPQPQEQPHG
jgi:hypothetical protein